MATPVRPNFLGYRGLGSVQPLELLSLDPRCLDLNNCGAPDLRRSDLFVEFSDSYVYNCAWQESTNPQTFLDERVQIASHGDFYLDRIAWVEQNNISIRFVYPNGRFSANRRITLNRYAAQGDDALTFLDPKVIPAGQWLGIEIEIAANTEAGQFSLALDGRVRYYLMPPQGVGALTTGGPRAF